VTTQVNHAAPAGAGSAGQLLATGDQRVLRTLADAERQRQRTAQQTAAADAETERQLRLAQGQLRLTEQRDEVADRRDERRRARREAQRWATRERRAARWATVRAALGSAVDYSRNNAPAVYSAAVYGLAVSGAVYGQLDAAHVHGLPWQVGLVGAIAIEGTGLSMALTAHQLRMKRERALAPRVLTWASTACAVAINYVGHAGYFGVHGDQMKAVGLGLLSLIGITVWEVRSAAKHRQVLREMGIIPEPPERYGWRRWVAAPTETWHAWRLDARTRVSPGAAVLIEQAAAEQTARAALAEREAIRVRARQLATRTARTAARKGAAGDALEALLRLAASEAPALALPAGGPASRAGEPTPALTGTKPAHPSVAGESTLTPPALPAPVDAEPAAAPVVVEPTRPALAVESAPVASGEPARTALALPAPAAVEPASRRRVAAATNGRRRVVTARTGARSVLPAAYEALCAELGRVPSGAELAERAGVSKAAANKWKAKTSTDTTSDDPTERGEQTS